MHKTKNNPTYKDIHIQIICIKYRGLYSTLVLYQKCMLKSTEELKGHGPLSS